MTLSIMQIIVMLVVNYAIYAGCHTQTLNAECHYSECRYAECRGLIKNCMKMINKKIKVL